MPISRNQGKRVSATVSRYTCTMFAGYYSITGQLPMATVVHLAVFVDA